ncbi:MAG: hypothetical protein KAS96_04700, partial [Planctomycetes bacterium]|nr:hypothetical protein [Planctomycetota bacterium]
MNESINKIYGNKAVYYIDFLAALDAAKSKYILLNFIVPDNDPGDMDIVIPFDEYEKAVHIMRQQ